MMTEDSSKYDEWEKAYTVLQRRREFCEAAKMLPGMHALVQYCERRLAEAQAAYDSIVSELD